MNRFRGIRDVVERLKIINQSIDDVMGVINGWRLYRYFLKSAGQCAVFLKYLAVLFGGCRANAAYVAGGQQRF